jgi:PIN domain nuclease of toxin-antitoxin system
LSFLLDSKCLLLAAFAPGSLPRGVVELLSNPDEACFVSPVGPYELELKKAKGKLFFPDVGDWTAAIVQNGYLILPVSIVHGVAAARLPFLHNDPWDRLLIAQAQAEGLTIISDDAAMMAYGVPMIWN